ncbi:SusC/RagA family TonB-linked outer membrane protein [Algoriphagus sp.]|uniref:SusC/RagA family TonB-linked outer membrane protein n=1 Tax=Algoriphagus sp. TaxID=1872435 RepID=UPI00262663D1|nr:SusC/RagA family TonB-linked outer membrane protein [Algoriphagus sp.]
MKKLLLIFILLVGGGSPNLWAQNSKLITGKVTSAAEGIPLPGVTIVVKGSNQGTITDNEGNYQLKINQDESVLLFSFIGYQTREIPVSSSQTLLNVALEESEMGLDEVMVVSTGFQELSAERTTGSFVKVDQELVDRRVSTNLIDRLEDVTPGLIFNRDRANAEPGESISIRGTATLRSNAEPLIVVDNLAYDGPLSSINPNDVESMTVLKDAAASSIWGARAGNGVIVITTKQGKFNAPMQVNFTANVTQLAEQDPFYQPRMSIAGHVDQQIELYERGYYNSLLNNSRNPVVPPVAESLFAHSQGLLSDQELSAQLDSYRNSDIRRELQEHINRRALQQQYALGLNGGSDRHRYQFSLGWDANTASTIASNNNRLTLSTRQNWKLANEKLDVGIGVYWVNSRSENGLPNISNFNAYDRLTDENGNPLSVQRTYSDRFKSEVEELGLLDWDYVPLEEFNRTSTTNSGNDLRINASLDYELLKNWKVSGLYQYWTNSNRAQTFNSQESYETRELINEFTEIGEDGSLIRHVPLGGILEQDFRSAFSHNVRLQSTYAAKWGSDHQLNVLAGFEVRDLKREGYFNTSYGYNPVIGTSQSVDYLTRRRLLGSGRFANVPFTESFSGGADRFLSGFANLGYSFKDRYLLNASARKDASNLFGVETNQRAVPLWSAGLGWIVSEEEFFRVSNIDFLKLRLSYGFNGNTNPNATAFTTAQYLSGAQNFLSGYPFLGIVSPPNPQLRWERIKIANLGLDFGGFNGKLRGSVEYYRKQGLDLLANQPLFASSGFSSAFTNYASTRTNGIDLNLTTVQQIGKIQWEGAFFYSMVQEEVTDLENLSTANQLLSYSAQVPNTQVGKPIFGIYSYDFAGLDPNDGSPLGFVDGEPSNDYRAIILDATPESLRFHGRGRPTDFGAFRNTFSYRGFSLSANITYRLGYFVRRQSINYDAFNRGMWGHADYESRWQQPGDELITDIPSDPGRVNPLRQRFYSSSSSRIERGDHIRLQDVRVAYQWNGGQGSRIRNLETYLYINNLGIIWKSTDRLKDPDYQVTPPLTSASLGLRMSF